MIISLFLPAPQQGHRRPCQALRLRPLCPLHPLRPLRPRLPLPGPYRFLRNSFSKFIYSHFV